MRLSLTIAVAKNEGLLSVLKKQNINSQLLEYMNHKFFRLTALSAAMFICAGSAMAVPARPVPVEVTQPDGSTLVLTPRGDESFHYLQTNDGYLVRQDNDGWFRIVGNDGQITTLDARDASSRDDAYTRQLSGIDPATAFANLQKISAASSRFNDYKADLNERFNKRLAAVAKADSQWDNVDCHDLRAFPSTGRQNVLVILVNFSDLKWSFCDNPHEEMQNMLQQQGYSNFDCTGSAYDYYTQSSNNLFRPAFDVYGPVDLPNTASYYGGNDYSGNDKNPEKMAIHACDILDPEVDFSQYDRDGDGVIDNVYIFYAGNGENEGAPSWTVWPHSWDVRYAGGDEVQYDGVILGHYACSNEVIYRTNTMTGIGTFCHEFSHVLGLPDLYATSYTSSHTPGDYSLMDQGSYNNNGRTPPLYSAYDRYALEWQKPVEITGNEEIAMLPLTQSGNVYKMTINSNRPTEYFLFENRKLEGFDTYIPAEGMLIWHIDFKQSTWDYNTVNNTPSDLGVDIVEADGVASTATMSGDTWPGSSNNTTFSGTSNPAFKNKAGDKSELALTRIRQLPGSLIAFQVGDGIDENSQYAITPIAASPSNISTDSFTLVFDNSKAPRREKGTTGDGENVYVSVSQYLFDDVEEAFIKSSVEGYELAKVNTSTPCTVSGLQPGVAYTVSIYRYTEENISNPYELAVTTVSENLADSHPEIFAKEVNSTDATIGWSQVGEVTQYLLTVATEGEATEPAEFTTVDFTNTPRVPTGWEYSGAFSTQEGCFGQTAPSFYMNQDYDYLWSETFQEEIGSLTLWTRALSGSTPTLGIYSVNSSGSLAPIAKVEELTTQAQLLTIDFPENVYAFVLIPENIGSNRIFVDDIVVKGRAGVELTPVAGYDAALVENTELLVEGLEPSTDYVAFVRAIDGETTGGRSEILHFSTLEPTGINSVAGKAAQGFYVANGILNALDASQAYDIYAVDGRAVAKDVKGTFELPARGLYIVRSGSLAVKINW